MLIHIVCWKYKSETGAAARDVHRARLSALVEKIPSILSLEVGADMLHLDRSFDTGLVARFAGRAGLDEYTVHPDHQAVAHLGKTIAEKVVSVDLIVGQ